VWKILSLLEKYELPATFYVPGYIADRYVSVVREIVERKCPVGLHGYLHESMDTLTREQEEDVIVRAKRSLSNLLGREPILYRAPSWELNRWTPDLLIKHGIISDSSLMDDEVPYALETDSGHLIEIPIQWILDDAEYWLHTRANRDKPISDPDTTLKIWEREFKGYYEHSGCYVLTLHPFISGRWVYMQTIEALIRYIRKFPRVWWTTVEEVTRYSESLLKVGQLRVKKPVPPEPTVQRR
jgi:Predicted xylanase/chitin deacetylase